LHIGLSPDFTELIEFIDLGIFNLYGAVLAGSCLVDLAATASTTCSGAHPTVKFPHQHTQLFIT
jgi:hypothetical protein